MGREANLVVSECESPRAVTRGRDSHQDVGTAATASADQIGIHWLRGSILDTEKAWLVDRVKVLWGQQFESHEHGFWVYDRHLAWPSGVKVLFHSTEEGADLTNGRIALEVPGSALDQLDVFQIGCFMRSLHERNFLASRLDVYFDDSQRTITPAALYQLVYEESLFEGVPIRHDIVGFRAVRKVTESNRTGRLHDEVAFGKRGKMGSGRYLRVYDKRLESKGEIDAVRWELELSDYRARRAFEKIVASLGDADTQVEWKPSWTIDVLSGLLASAIDFKKRIPGVKNLKRLQRYDFWTAILSRLGWASLAAKRLVKTVERAREWVQRQVAGTLQMLVKALGEEIALPLVFDLATAENRLRPSHRRAISEYLRERAGPLGGALPS